MNKLIRFTPRLLDAESLEQLFANREDLLKISLERIESAGNGRHQSHTLFLGPHGSGKTYLIAMIYHAAKALREYGKGFSVSLLTEDPYDITSFELFLEAIGENREPETMDQACDPTMTIVLTENFDWILESMGEIGQQQLRAHIERNENLLIIASSTKLTEGIYKQAMPFYGFFDVIELKPFSITEAITMLQKIAQYNGDKTMEVRLEDPDVKARLSAIEQIAGGQPRTWATLAPGLDLQDIQDLTDLLITQFDDLTPYYQGQMARLSGNQKRVVLALIKSNRAMAVQDIAEMTGIDQRSLSKTLIGLQPGWVVPLTGYLTNPRFIDGRNKFYQLADPLARIENQIKDSKGKPAKTIVDFLTAWYSRGDMEKPSYIALQDSAIRLKVGESIDRNAFFGEKPVQDTQNPDNEIVGTCILVDEALREFQHSGTTAKILALPTGIVNLIESQLSQEKRSVGMLRIELALVAVRAGGAEEWLARALDAFSGIQPHESKSAQFSIASLRMCLGLFESGMAAFELLSESGYV